MASVPQVIQSVVRAASANKSFLATITQIQGVLVQVQRIGQTSPDPVLYPCLVVHGTNIVNELSVGETVSVVEHGALWIVMGAVDTSTTPPPVPPPPTATGMYTGVWQPDPAVDGNLLSLQTFEADAQKKQAIVAFWRDWVVASKGTIPASTLSQIGAHGSVPFVTWNPTDFSGATDPATFALANITAGNFDTYLQAQAATLAAYGKPVFVRTMHEMNGTWYPWAGDPANFVPAWRHIHDVVRGVAPLTQFVWCPNVWVAGGVAVVDPQPYYPGDAYVDWVGIDGYNSERLYGSWQTFSEVFGFSYGQLVSAHAKPLMICEWGCDEDPRKAAWYTSALTTEIPEFFPKLSAEIYFNESKGVGADWPIESDNAAKAAYAAGLAAAYYLTTVT